MTPQLIEAQDQNLQKVVQKQEDFGEKDFQIKKN